MTGKPVRIRPQRSESIMFRNTYDTPSNLACSKEDCGPLKKNGKLYNNEILRCGWTDDIGHLFLTDFILCQTLALYSLY